MHIDVRQHGEVSLVRLREAFKGSEAAAEFREAIESVLGQGIRRLVLNLAEMPTVDSSGITEIVLALRETKRLGGTLRLVSPSKFTHQTMKVVGILNLFTIYNSEQDAMAADA